VLLRVRPASDSGRVHGHAGHHHERTPLRFVQETERLDSAAHLPGRAASLNSRDFGFAGALDAPVAVSRRGYWAALRAHIGRVAPTVPEVDRRSPRVGLRRSILPDVGLLSGLLRGRIP